MGISDIINANGPFFLTAFLLLSMSAVALAVWRLIRNIRANTKLDDFVKRLEDELERSGVEGATQLCESESAVVPRLFLAVIRNGHRGRVAARNAIADCIETEIMPSLTRSLPWLLLIAKIAPMVGLLGTVVGMILAFNKIAGATKVDPSALAQDIGMALFTTAEGLLIAIPVIFVYTHFRERIRGFEVDLQRGAQIAMEMLPRFAARTK